MKLLKHKLVSLLLKRARQALDSAPGGSTIGAGLDVGKDLADGKTPKDIAMDRYLSCR